MTRRGDPPKRLESRAALRAKGALSLLDSEIPAALGLPGGEASAGLSRDIAKRPEPENELFLPVHGFVDLLEEEVAVLNHPALQRLGRIYQLGQSNLVFRGATHTRLEHVLGTLSVAQGMLDALVTNGRRALRKGTKANHEPSPWDDPLSPLEEAYVRLGALLHDIGHLPAGHTLEDELGLLEKHDEIARLTVVFDRVDWPGGTTDSLREVIDHHYRRDWSPGEGLTPVEVVLQLIAKDYNRDQSGQFASAGIRLEVCRDIIGNTICADLLDYLHRDWYHIGKPKYFDKRLFQYMEIRKFNGAPSFVISLGRSPKLRTDAITAILALLESRYELAETVLFHRTKCAAAAMLERAVFEIQTASKKALEGQDERDAWKQALVHGLLDCSDDGALSYLSSMAAELGAPAAALPLDALQQRRLYRMISTTFREDFRSTERDRVQDLYASRPNAAEMRNLAMRVLEGDFELAPGALAMYCPEKGMNSKIALVKVHADGRVAAFKDWDGADSSEELSGGHIRAQLARFQRLWRVNVAIDRHEWARLSPGRQDALRRAIRICVLGQCDAERTIEDEARAIAILMRESAEAGSKFSGSRIENAPQIAAVGTTVLLQYPTGIMSLLAFCAQDG